MDSREDRAPGAGALVATVAAVLAAALAAAGMRLPATVSEEAPAERFSALRAVRHVEALSGAPRTLGSPDHARAAEYILAEMKAVGLATEVHETTWLRHSRGGSQTGARVRNLVGRLPGAAGPEADTLLLLAHYDSQPQTFGAADDASGVAVILETLRALAGEPWRNEVLAVVTDGEELGLIGAEAFVGEHPAFERVDMTLNFEARGNRGPAIMFEASTGSLGRVRDLAREAPYPIADSLSYEVYRRMPNDTDFSVIRRAGGQGLNFAFVEGHPAYHSWLDTAPALDLRTLQQEGDNALALARRYLAAPIPSAEGADGVYFNPLGSGFLWVYSNAVARGAAGLTLVLLAVAVWRGRARLGRVVLAAGLLLPAVVLAMGMTWAARRGVATFLPEAAAAPHGVPYDQAAATLGYVALAVFAWLACLRGWSGGRRELLLGVALAWSSLGGVVTVVAPGASHLFVWPAALLVAGVLVADFLPTPVRWWAPALCVLPAVVWWTRTLWLAHVSLTVHAAVPLAAAAVLAATLLTPAWDGASRRMASLGCVAALGLGIAALFLAHGSPATAERPRANSLFVLHDVESGEATWRSLDDGVDQWTAAVMGGSPARLELPEALDASSRSVLTSPAAPVESPAARVDLESDERPGVGGVARRVDLRLVPGAGSSLRVWVRAEVALKTASLDGRAIELDDRGELRLSLHGVPAEGVVLRIELSDRWPLQVDLIDVAYGLPAGRVDARPAHLVPRPGWWTDTTMVWSHEVL